MSRFALRHRLLVIGPLVLLLLLSGIYPSPKQSLAQALVTLDPSSGLPGTTVHATGSGWVSGDHIEVRWETHDLLVQTIVNNSGGLDFYFTVPFEAISGNRTIYFNDVTNGFSLPQSFIVEIPDSVWLGNSQGGDLVWMVIKGSYITTIQFKSTAGSVKTCFNVLITNYQFSCTTNGGSTTIEGHYLSLNQVVGTYTNYGQQVQWTAAIFSQSISLIGGQITDSTNSPITGVAISATGPTNISATTDANGIYTLSGLADGSYTITPSKSGYTFNPPSFSLAVPPDATGKNFIGTATTQPTIDLAIDSVSPVQVLEGQDLVKDKATAVKVVVHKTGSGTVNDVSVRLDLNSFASRRFYVAESPNMDKGSNYKLKNDNTVYPLNFASGEVTKAIYFFGDNIAPTESTFQTSATVDDQNTVAETVETNNTTPSKIVSVHDTRWGQVFPGMRIYYFRADWDNTSINDYVTFYQSNNDFIQATYPVSPQQFSTSRNDYFVADTHNFIYRGLDDKMNRPELANWAKTTLAHLKVLHPTVDRFIATVPAKWFANNTTIPLSLGVNPHEDLSILFWPQLSDMIIAETRRESRVNGPSVVAHELGHSYGLYVSCEEYDANCDGMQDRVGAVVSPGVWVDKHMIIQASTERPIYNFMGSYGDNEYWVSTNTYSKLLTEPKSALTTGSRSQVTTTNAILAVGMFDSNAGVKLDNWYVLPEAELSVLPSGPYSFEYIDTQNNILYQQDFDISYALDGETLTQSPFVFTIPYVPGTAKILIKKNGNLLGEKIVSPTAPVVSIISPNGNQQFTGQTTIQWNGTDADNDELSYSLAFSLDNGITWEPIAFDLRETSYLWNITRLPAGSQYLVKIIATDGVNTGQDISDASFTIQNMVFLPFTRR